MHAIMSAFAIVKERGTGGAVNKIKSMGGCKVLLKSDCVASPSNIEGKEVHWGLDHCILAEDAGQNGLKACTPGALWGSPAVRFMRSAGRF